MSNSKVVVAYFIRYKWFEFTTICLLKSKLLILGKINKNVLFNFALTLGKHVMFVLKIYSINL